MDLKNSFEKVNNFSSQGAFKFCICERKGDNVIVCTRCKQTFVGRISQRCPKHPEITFLMDARQCAFCGAHANYLQVSESPK